MRRTLKKGYRKARYEKKEKDKIKKNKIKQKNARITSFRKDREYMKSPKSFFISFLCDTLSDYTCGEIVRKNEREKEVKSAKMPALQ